MKSNNMPISEVMDNLIISKDAKLSAVYKLDLPSKYETAKIEERETLSDRIKNFINSIDSNTYLQFYYDFQKKDNPKKYKKEDYGDKLINKVQHSRVDHLSNISHLDMKLFCTITISIKSHKQKSVFKNILFSGENKETTEREYQKAKNKLERSLRKFEDFINLQEKIDYKRLQNKEIRQLLIAHYNNYSYEHVKKNDIDIQDNYLDINKKLLRKDYIVEKSHLQIDEEKVKIIRIDDLFTATMPAIKNSDMYQYSISLLHSILYDLDFQHKTIINIQNVDKKDIVKKVKRNKRIESTFASSTDRKQNKKEQEIEQFLNDMAENTQKVCLANIYVIIKDTNLERLQRKANKVQTKFNKINSATAKIETNATLPLFISAIPGSASQDFEMKLLKTENVADCINLYDYYKNDDRGILATNRKNKAVRLDLQSDRLTNRNGIIIGPSGAGKSFTMNSMLFQEISDGAITFIIDKWASYKKLMQILDGTWYQFNLDTPISINPFRYPKKRYIEEEKISERKIQFLIKFISSLVKDSKESVEDIDKKVIVTIENCIKEVYKKKYLKKDKDIVLLEDYYEVFKSKKDQYKDSYINFQKYIDNLKSYLQRKVFADYFNNKTKINVGSNKHVYFDISGLDENKELRSLIVMNLVDMMFQFIDNNKDRKKRIVIDEAWDSLQNKKIGLSKYIMNMFRYIRKLSGGVWVISQSALDFNTKEMKASIQTNISTLIVMQQTKKQILEDTCEVFGFNEEEKELLNSIELNIQKGYSEAFISQGNFSTILRINESPFNYWMFTTDADDNALFREEVKKYGNLNDSNAVVRAIKSLANP